MGCKAPCVQTVLMGICTDQGTCTDEGTGTDCGYWRGLWERALPANGGHSLSPCRHLASLLPFCGSPALILSILASPGATVSRLTQCGSFMPLNGRRDARCLELRHWVDRPFAGKARSHSQCQYPQSAPVPTVSPGTHCQCNSPQALGTSPYLSHMPRSASSSALAKAGPSHSGECCTLSRRLARSAARAGRSRVAATALAR